MRAAPPVRCIAAVVVAAAAFLCFGGAQGELSTAPAEGMAASRIGRDKPDERARFRFDCDKNLEMYPPEGKQLRVGSSSLMLDPATGNLKTDGTITLGGMDLGAMMAEFLAFKTQMLADYNALKQDHEKLQTKSDAQAEAIKQLNKTATGGKGAATVAGPALCEVMGPVLRGITGRTDDSCELPTELDGLELDGLDIMLYQPILGAVETINGPLTIKGQPDMRSLEGLLPRLKNVTGPIRVSDMDNLEEVTFPSLQTAHSITISSCNTVAELGNAFPELTAVTDGQIYIRDMDGLETLEGAFGSLQTAHSIQIQRCEKVATLGSAFPELTAVTDGQIRIVTMDGLETLGSAFGSLQTAHSIEINGCRKVATLANAFPELTAVTAGKIYINNMAGLETLGGAFPSLQTAHSITIHNCDKLTTLASAFPELAALTSTGTDALHIDNNNLLTAVGAGATAAFPKLPEESFTGGSFFYQNGPAPYAAFCTAARADSNRFCKLGAKPFSNGHSTNAAEHCC